MTISLTVLLLLIWIHFVADFLLQSDKMAVNKSTSSKWLAIHCSVYALPLFIFGWQFALVNLALHLITDSCSSRIAKYFHTNGKVHWFFVTIGFDQAIHLTTLVLTYYWLVE